MGLLAAWLLFPLALSVLALGWGLLVERLSGRDLPGVLLLPLGLAAVLVVARVLVEFDFTRRLALPLLALVAVATLVLLRGRVRRLRWDSWAAAGAIGAALVIAAPVILSGDPTFAGSLVLGDTAHQMALAARLADAGPDWQSLPLSSYSLGVRKYFISAYPLGPQAALGLLAPLGVIDLAWLYQPFLALLVLATALSLNALVAPWVPSRRARALVSFVAAQPALLVAFAFQGSIKEIAGMAMAALVFALAAQSIVQRWPARAFSCLAVGALAAVGALGPPAVAYVGPPLLVAAGAWAWRVRRGPYRPELAGAAVVVAATVLLALPILTGASTAVTVGGTVLSDASELGNLARQLDVAQVSGAWLTGDYRYPPPAYRADQALSALLAVLALVGVVMAVKRRSYGPLLVVGTILPVTALLLSRGSPYADAKVLALASFAIPLLAMMAAAWLFASQRRWPRLGGAAIALLVTGAVLGSNALAYHEIQLAPYDRYEEMREIGERFGSGEGMLLADYDEYAKHVLRDARPLSQPEYPFEFPDGPYKQQNWRDAVSDRRRQPWVKAPLDVDAIPQPTLQAVSTIVKRHSPTASRPPSNFRRVFSGRYYEVWKRTGKPVLRHKTFGESALSPANPPKCDEIRDLARVARKAGGRLAYVERSPQPLFDPLADSKRNPRFGLAERYQYRGYPKSLIVNGPGDVASQIRIPRAGRYRLWFAGSFSRPIEVKIDGKTVGTLEYDLGNPGAYLELGERELSAGTHTLELSRGGGDLKPGNGGKFVSNLAFFGPLVFSDPANERLEVQHVDAKDATTLCGRTLDWVEVVL